MTDYRYFIINNKSGKLKQANATNLTKYLGPHITVGPNGKNVHATSRELTTTFNSAGNVLKGTRIKYLYIVPFTNNKAMYINEFWKQPANGRTYYEYTNRWRTSANNLNKYNGTYKILLELKNAWHERQQAKKKKKQPKQREISTGALFKYKMKLAANGTELTNAHHNDKIKEILQGMTNEEFKNFMNTP
jgi:hypothetical protein